MTPNEFATRHGFPEWTVKFRPGATRTHQFGWRYIFDKLSWHNGIDSDESDTTGFDIFCPFQAVRIEFRKDVPSDFYSLLVIKFADVDFEMRIAHMDEDDLTVEARQAVQYLRPWGAGRLLGKCGNMGKSTGRHAHTELVSTGPYSEHVERFLLLKFGDAVYQSGDPAYDYDFAYEHISVNHADFNAIKKSKMIFFYNKYLCRRHDYMDGGKPKTWYSSYLAFNGL